MSKIGRPDNGKNRTGTKRDKQKMRGKIKNISKEISKLYPSVKGGSFGDDYFDEKIWASNGAKHPYKGQDLVENYIANQVLAGRIYQDDGFRLLELLEEATSLGDFVDTMHTKGWYTLNRDVHGGVANFRFVRVGHVNFWERTKCGLLSRPTLAEYIVQQTKGLKRTEESLAEVEALLKEYDQNAGPVGAQNDWAHAGEVFMAKMDLLLAQEGSVRSESQQAQEKLLTFDEANERMKTLKLSSSADEARNRIQSAQTDNRRSYDNDPFMQRRFNLVKEDAANLNAPQCLFSILSTRLDNFLIQRHPAYRPGFRKDWTWHPSVCESTSEHKKAFEYFKQTLKCPGMFAVPTWWYGEVQHMYALSVTQHLTKDFDEPFPTGSFKSVISRASGWYKRLEESNPILYEDHTRRSIEYMKDRSSAEEYPEMVPFKTTFINLEDESNAGHLLYNRSLNQFGQVRQHMVPTTAHAPDGRLVALDVIFQSGFYFRESDEDNPLGRRVIYGLYHGYAINREDCPDGMDFIRISMVCPFHIDGQWYPHLAEFDGHLCEQSPIIPVIGMMIDALNEHKTVVRSFTKAERKRSVKVGKSSGVGKVSPRRYTRVQMSAGTTSIPPIEDCPLMRLPKWKLSKQVRCRKHERCYVRDGLLPIGKDHFDLLVSRGYTIYKDNLEIGPRDLKRLKLRDVELPNGYRWVAIRTIIVEEHEKGPEDEEIVPLVLVPQNKVLKDSADFELSAITK